jgi:3-deoxy-7-phosphoheptulonate synthase
MIVVMKQGASDAQVTHVAERIKELGLTPHLSRGQFRTIIGAIGEEAPAKQELLRQIDGVEQVLQILKPYKLCSREFHPHDTVLDVRGIKIGGTHCAVIGGPCTIEDLDMLETIAKHVKQAGARILRGGAFKPRTSPYQFQGLREEGLRLLEEVKRDFDLRIVTEAKDTETLAAVAECADIIQIGARNMQNFSLLEAAGRQRKPVLLKRGMSATIQELFMAAEYLLSLGNYNVILCERGIRTFETMTRNTFDLAAVVMMKRHSHLPVMADPSHGVGINWAVASMARASVAAGADAVMLEVHPDPAHALSDGQQSLTIEQYARLAKDLNDLAVWQASR